jgi:excisionase family DNA binding protein
MTATASVREPIVARDDERSQIASVERSLYLLPARKAKLIGPDGKAMILPDSLYRVLLEAARQLGEGNGIALMAYTQNLTTQQAADLLNVSRPHLVTLLESGAIPFHKVGTHRRVYLRDLLRYKRQRDGTRRAALQSMVDEAQKLGIYVPTHATAPIQPPTTTRSGVPSRRGRTA